MSADWSAFPECPAAEMVQTFAYIARRSPREALERMRRLVPEFRGGAEHGLWDEVIKERLNAMP